MIILSILITFPLDDVSIIEIDLSHSWDLGPVYME